LVSVSASTYLVFGDLHGRVLPAFRLALAWQNEHGVRLDALLQVGDLGYFPDPARLDKATRRHAERDPLELGAALVVRPSREADAVFADPDLPEGLWFVPGNHEDFEALDACREAPGASPSDFPVDHYGRVRCIRDGQVAVVPGGLRVGGLWGIEGRSHDPRRKGTAPGRISERRATELAAASFDVLLTHDAPRDAVFPDSGSEAISTVLALARPAFAFFGHYHTPGRLAECNFGPTQVIHLHGLELRGKGGTAEEGSVGVLLWGGRAGSFAYLESDWLRTFTRDNWPHR
jgi:hypothetical protein